MKKWLWRPEKERGKEREPSESSGCGGAGPGPGVGSAGARWGSNPQNWDVILLRARWPEPGGRAGGVAGAGAASEEKAGWAGQPG